MRKWQAPDKPGAQPPKLDPLQARWRVMAREAMEVRQEARGRRSHSQGRSPDAPRHTEARTAGRHRQPAETQKEPRDRRQKPGKWYGWMPGKWHETGFPIEKGHEAPKMCKGGSYPGRRDPDHHRPCTPKGSPERDRSVETQTIIQLQPEGSTKRYRETIMRTQVEDPDEADTLRPVTAQIWTAPTTGCSWRMEMPWRVNSGMATSLMAWTQYEALH